MIPAAHIKPEKVTFALGFRLDKLILRELLELESRQPLLIWKCVYLFIVDSRGERKRPSPGLLQETQFLFVQFMLVLSFDSLKRKQRERLYWAKHCQTCQTCQNCQTCQTLVNSFKHHLLYERHIRKCSAGQTYPPHWHLWLELISQPGDPFSFPLTHLL